MGTGKSRTKQKIFHACKSRRETKEPLLLFFPALCNFFPEVFEIEVPSLFSAETKRFASIEAHLWFFFQHNAIY